MTTLEERREWIRAGCPIEEPKPKAGKCDAYRLQVRLSDGVIVATCYACERVAVSFTRMVQRAGRTEFRPRLDGHVEALGSVCGWMEKHGGMTPGTAECALVYAHDGEGVRIYRWMADLMDGEAETVRGPVGAIGSECGRYAFAFDPHPRPLWREMDGGMTRAGEFTLV